MRRCFLVLLCVLLCGALAMPTCATEEKAFDEVLVFDNGKVLRSSQKAVIRERLETVSKEFQVYLYLLTEAAIGDQDPVAYAEKFYFSNGLGCGKQQDGILLLLCMDRREWAIYGVGLGEQAIADGKAQEIGQKIRPALIDGDYVEAVTVFGAECMTCLDKTVNREKNPVRAGITMVIFLGSAGALIVTGVIQSRKKKRKEI